MSVYRFCLLISILALGACNQERAFESPREQLSFAWAGLTAVGLTRFELWMSRERGEMRLVARSPALKDTEFGYVGRLVTLPKALRAAAGYDQLFVWHLTTSQLQILQTESIAGIAADGTLRIFIAPYARYDESVDLSPVP